MPDDQDDELIRASALYDQVAQRLRDEIERGTYVPGDSLPSVVQLAQHYGVSEGTVRSAIAALRAQGLIDVSQGRRPTVRRPPLQLTLRRYSRAARKPGAGPFEQTCRDLHIPGYGELVLVEQREADDLMAGRLEIAPGDQYVYRRRYMHAGEPDRIVQIQEGHIPLAIAGGTPLAGTAKIVDGTYAALDAIGHGPATITEEVSARMPTLVEQTVMLPQASGTAVLHIARTTRDEAGRVVELLYVTALSDSNVFVYEDLPVT